MIENRENFAKNVMMLFYFHRDRDLRDLKSQNGEGTFWEKFVEAGGLTPYKAKDGKRLDFKELRAKGGGGTGKGHPAQHSGSQNYTIKDEQASRSAPEENSKAKGNWGASKDEYRQ